MMDEDFDVGLWYSDCGHEGFQQWDEAGSEDLEEDEQ